VAVSLNKSVIGGNLTSDVELKQTQSGLSVARASVAVHRKRAKQGEQSKTDFIECVFWRHSAEFLSRYAHKGDNVVVCGELQNESWTDAQGKSHAKLVLVADEVELNSAKKAETAPQFEELGDSLPYDTPF
jgi:single-strand DNA-binding protein